MESEYEKDSKLLDGLLRYRLFKRQNEETRVPASSGHKLHIYCTGLIDILSMSFTTNGKCCFCVAFNVTSKIQHDCVSSKKCNYLPLVFVQLIIGFTKMPNYFIGIRPNGCICPRNKNCSEETHIVIFFYCTAGY